MLRPSLIPPTTPLAAPPSQGGASDAPVWPATAQTLPEVGEGLLPSRLLIAPVGRFTGRDGRAYELTPDEAYALAAALNTDRADVPVDWEHATELRGPLGERADAAGWLSDWWAMADGLSAAVAWNAAGADSVTARQYRYYSPAFMVDQARRIRGVSSVGLTNKPNLAGVLPALNRETEMKLDDLRQLLSLPVDADEPAVMGALESALAKTAELETELHRAKVAALTPDLSRFVPRADYDAALNRATEAETALRTAREAEQTRAIDALIATGLETGRITPATVEYHRAQASTAGGMERLRVYVESAPRVLSDPVTRPATPPDAKPELNAEQRIIMAAFGMTPELLAQFAGETT